MLCVNGWEAVEEVGQRFADVKVYVCGALGNDSDNAPKNNNALDQKWKCKHYPIIPYRLSERHFGDQHSS